MTERSHAAHDEPWPTPEVLLTVLDEVSMPEVVLAALNELPRELSASLAQRAVLARLTRRDRGDGGPR